MLIRYPTPTETIAPTGDPKSDLRRRQPGELEASFKARIAAYGRKVCRGICCGGYGIKHVGPRNVVCGACGGRGMR